MEKKQIEYATTTFKASQGRNKVFSIEKAVPPAGGGWRMINFHPVNSVEPLTTYFVAVWERE